MQKNKNVFMTTVNAINGLKVLFAENAAKRELILLLLSIAIYGFFPSGNTFALIALSILALSIEGLNTAIELICDHVTPEIHPQIKKIKDVASASLLLIFILMFVVFIRALFEHNILAL